MPNFCQTFDATNNGNTTAVITYRPCGETYNVNVTLPAGFTTSIPCNDQYSANSVDISFTELSSCRNSEDPGITLTPIPAPTSTPTPTGIFFETNTPTPTPFQYSPTPAPCTQLFLSASSVGSEATDWYVVNGTVADCSNLAAIDNSNPIYVSSSNSSYNQFNNIPINDYGAFTSTEFASGIEFCATSQIVTIITWSENCGTQCIEVNTGYIPNTPTPTPTPTPSAAPTSTPAPTNTPLPTPTPTPTPGIIGQFRDCDNPGIVKYANRTQAYVNGNFQLFPQSGNLNIGNVVQMRDINSQGNPTGATYCMEYVGPSNQQPTGVITYQNIVRNFCGGNNGQNNLCFQ